MLTEPIHIEGLAGPLVVNTSARKKGDVLTVGGMPVAGGRRGKYELPAAGGGTVTAIVHDSLLEPFPRVEIGGVKYRTGPASPVFLKLLGVLPMGLLFVGGAIGGVVGFGGVTANLAVGRTTYSNAAKALVMILVAMTAVAAYAVVAGVVDEAFFTGQGGSSGP